MALRPGRQRSRAAPIIVKELVCPRGVGDVAPYRKMNFSGLKTQPRSFCRGYVFMRISVSFML